MKDFRRPAGSLGMLPVASRIAYSAFLVATLAALGLSVWLGAEMVGNEASGVDAYYAGIVGEPAPGADASGPAIEIALEDEAAPRVEPMSRRRLLETTHFHLFSMPLYFLALSHLFLLTRMSSAWKLAWIAAAALGIALHVAAPWIAAAGGGRVFFATSGILLVASHGVLCAVPLSDMWLAGR